MSANSYVKTSATRAFLTRLFFYHTFSAERFACHVRPRKTGYMGTPNAAEHTQASGK